jgi:hypothetical protein
MKYLKAINNEIITYPYTFSHLRSEHPNTCFPSDFMQGNYDVELQNYNVFSVIISEQPTVNENQYVVLNNIPEFINNQWILNYSVVDKSSEQIKQEKFNPMQFKKELNLNSKWQQWTDSIIAVNPKSLIFLLEAFNNYIANGDQATIQSMYNQLKTVIPIPENSDSEWQEIADIYGIDITF